jgi:hypothetical protein
MTGSNVKIHVRASFLFSIAATAIGCGATHVVLNNDPAASGGGGASITGAGGEGGEGCSGQCAPLGPGEWLGPLLLWIGKEGEAPDCPASAPVEGAPVFADLNAPLTCGLCKCDAPSGTCTLPSTLTAASAPCSGDGPGVVHTSFDAPAAWSGSCTDANLIAKDQKCGGANCVQSLTVAPLTLAENPCAVSVEPVAAKLPHTWGTAARSCHGVAYGPCATSDEVCAPAAVPGFAQCLVRDGDRDCPAPYTVRNVFYSGLTDTRVCTPCACGAPVGGACSALVSVYKDGACSSPGGSIPVDAAGPKCLDVPSGQALGSKLATEPVYAPGACQASGGEPMGQALPEGPSTYCCLP